MDQHSDLPHRNRGSLRQASHDKRAPLQRRSTRGPLDDPGDDLPLPPTPTPSTPKSPPKEATNTALPMALDTPLRSAMLSPPLRTSSSRSAARSPSPSKSQIDLSFLLQPTLYNPMPARDVAAPFVNSKHQPAPDTPLNDLLSRGHFRHAADKAADELTSSTLSQFDHASILYLYQIRLSCLMLASRPDFAAQEARPLSEWIARSIVPQRGPLPDRRSDVKLIPWDLRLLLQRLQTTASGDGRRGVMGLYALGSECRASAAAAHASSNDEGYRLWTSRLADLGLRVASELIEMGELDAAVRHLETLESSETETEVAVHKTLLYLRIGDIGAAERTVATLPKSDTDSTTSLLTALTQISQSDYTDAVLTLTNLHEKEPANELVTTNLAVAYLYSGDQERAYSLLSSLAEKKETLFPGLLFNMATMYELRTERAVEKKQALAIQVADMGPSELGWERVGAEFKL